MLRNGEYSTLRLRHPLRSSYVYPMVKSGELIQLSKWWPASTIMKKNGSDATFSIMLGAFELN